MNNSFYRLNFKWTWAASRKQAEWDHEKMESALEIIRCPADPGHQREGKRLKNLNVVLPDGEVEDFIWTWYNECLVQDDTLERMCSDGLTGFDVKPVNARFKTSGEIPPKLWELVLTGWAGMVPPETGVALDKTNSCPVCGHLKYTGLEVPEKVVDKNKWDGSDFFMVWPMPRYLLVTERVVRTLRHHQSTGVQIVPLPELKKTAGFTPGRLHYYMADQRARRLGEPLDIY